MKLDGLPVVPDEKLNGLPFEPDEKQKPILSHLPFIPGPEAPDRLLLLTHRLAHQLLSGFPGPLSGLPFTPGRDPTEG